MGESVLTEFKSMRRTLWFFRRNKENRRTLTFLSDLFFPNESHGLQFFDYGQDLVRAYSAWACPCKNGGKSVSKHLTDGFSCSCWRHLQIECQHGLNWNLGLSLSSFRPVCPPVTSSSQSVIRSPCGSCAAIFHIKLLLLFQSNSRRTL